MEAIGGYFELANYEEGSVFPYQDSILLNTGRNALEYILRSIEEVNHIYLPYYTCEMVLEPIEKLHIPYAFYHTDQQFEIVDNIQPKEGQYIIANNYFGIKDAYIQQLAELYGDHLIVDCAQAFFAKLIPDIKAFYSTRKYVGVADGGVAYLGNLPVNRVEVNEIERSNEHDSHLLKRKQFGAEAGFADYQANEIKLNNQPIRWMSENTKQILAHINYERVIARRRENFQYLHEALAERNQLTLPNFDTFVCPMVYPFMMDTERDLRNELIKNKIFVAKYWPNVDGVDCSEIEGGMATGIIPLPIDQRYGKEEMNRIIDMVKQ